MHFLPFFVLFGLIIMISAFLLLDRQFLFLMEKNGFHNRVMLIRIYYTYLTLRSDKLVTFSKTLKYTEPIQYI